MDATTSLDSIVMLFYETIDVMSTYGLLPRGLNVRQAHQFIDDQGELFKAAMQHHHTPTTIWYAQHQKGAMPELKNKFCMVYAKATKIPGYSPNPVIIPFGVLLGLGLCPALIGFLLGNEEATKRLVDLGLSLWMHNPLRFSNYVIFKGYTVEFHTLGLKGLVSTSFNESGAFIGFTGLMHAPSNDTTYFLGFTYYIYGS